MNNEERILHMLEQMQDNIGQMQGDIKHMQDDISGLKQNQQQTNERLEYMENDIKDIKNDIKELKYLSKTIFNQTADLTEFRTETNMKLDKISDTIDFLTHKETQNEKELFTIKKNLQIVK